MAAQEMIPLFADLSFVYLRRLADQFARASRYVLFTDYASTPQKYKELGSFLADTREVERCKPLCDACPTTTTLGAARVLAASTTPVPSRASG